MERIAGYADVEYLESFDILAMVNGKWELLKNHVLQESIPLFELDEGAHIVDTNQGKINEAMKKIISEIKENGIIYPEEFIELVSDDDVHDLDTDMLYIPKENPYIIKLVGKTVIVETTFYN